MVVRIADLMHAISIFDARALEPYWLASGCLDLNCDTCFMDEHVQTGIHVIRTVAAIFPYLCCSYFGHILDKITCVCKDVVNMDSTIQSTLRRLCIAWKIEDFGSLSAVWTIEPSRPDDMPYRPDASQTKHHPSGRRTFPSGPSTVSRSFYPACIRPDNSAARPDAYHYWTSFRFFRS